MAIFDASKIKKKNTVSKEYTVLLVDDEELTLHTLKFLLKEYYNVLTANDGKEALELIEGLENPEQIQVIISDQRMPNMTGVEFLEKTVDIIPDTIRLLLTGYTDVDTIIEAINKGHIYKFILKPFESNHMLTTIKRALETYELGRKNFKLLQELKTVNEGLENTIAERTRELKESNEELKTQTEKLEESNLQLKEQGDELLKVNANKNKFFRIIAHDLKSPFNGILGFSEILANDINNLSTETVERIAGRIYPHAQRLFSLLENLLEWSTIQMEGLSWNPEKTDLRELVEENIRLLEGVTHNKEIQVINEIQEPLYAPVDPNMIKTVIRNLLSNAIKFTHSGGEIKIGFKQHDEVVEISVSDNGVGIPEKNIQKLFKIEENSTTPGTLQEKGTGLGLILCKELVEQHQGKIWGENNPEKKGAIFYFCVPKELS